MASRVHVFQNGTDDWWAECLICRAWVATANLTKDDAEARFGRHLQNDHEAGVSIEGNEIGTAPPRGRERVPPAEASRELTSLAGREVLPGPDVEVARGPTHCPRCGATDVMWGHDPAQQRSREEIHPALWDDTAAMADTFICRDCSAGWIEPDEVQPITWVRPYWRQSPTS